MTGRILDDGDYGVPPGKIAEVVTSLAMDAPPARREPEDRADLRLRHVPAPNLERYRTLFRRVGEPWLWTSRLLLDDAALGAILHDPAVAVFVVDHAGEESGLLELDFRVAGECELTFFGLAPGLTGQGIGRWLMDHALAEAWVRPIRRMWLHTCTLDHPAALTFYRRCGFVPFRRQVTIADDPRLGGVMGPEAGPGIPRL